jgi:hypothetical protein
VPDLLERIDALDPELFTFVEAQTDTSDRRALLALHSAVAAKQGSFEYLEIGSYLGGSLQVLVRDPRCRRIISIDPRPDQLPDNRAEVWSYPDNATAHMRSLLAKVPDADLSKLLTHACAAESLDPEDCGGCPDLCFVDGEHTDEAVLADARFCARAVQGTGVIAFHDQLLVKSGLRTFLREAWTDISRAMVLSHGYADGRGVFAIEIGDSGVLLTPAVVTAIDSAWHRVAWRLGCMPNRSPRALFAIWDSMPGLDRAILDVRRRLHGG